MQKLLTLVTAGIIGLTGFLLITNELQAPQQIDYSAEVDGGSIAQNDRQTEADDQPVHQHEVGDGHGHEHTDESLSDQAHSDSSPITSKYLQAYTLSSDEYGTNVSVTLTDTMRIMSANALANHPVGDFPSAGNPNTISAQEVLYQIPLNPTFTGTAQFARTPGVALNGVKFEPQTAERVTCESGEVYSIEAIQDMLSLGLDFNNAHVQPTGAYHYHGVADNLVDVFDQGSDLVHVGFAMDGHLMYYSKSGAYQSSYGLSTTARTGTDCTFSMPNFSINEDFFGTKPDGTYVSDWVYTAGAGDLDECNGATINGEYAYLITDAYPYIPRCLMGEFIETASGGGGGQSGSGAGAPTGGSERPAGQRPRR